MPNPWESAPLDHRIAAATDSPAPWESAPAQHQDKYISDWGENNTPEDNANAWSDTYKKPYRAPKRYPTPVDDKNTGFDQTGEEALAARGFRPDETKRLGGQAGVAWLLSKLGKGSLLGDASDTTMGKMVTGMSDLPLGVIQGLSHLTGNGERADAAMRIREQLLQENQDPKTQFKPLPVVGDPARFAGGLATPIPGMGEMKGAVGVGKAAGLGGLLGFLQPNPNVQYDEQGDSDYLGSATSGGLKGVAINTLLHGGTRLVGNKLAGKTVTKAPGNVNTLGEDITSNLSSSAQADVAELTKVASGQGIRANKAQRILDEINQTGIDPTNQTQLSARVKQVLEQGENDVLFAKRDKLMQGVTSTAPRTVAELDAQIAVLDKNPYPGADITASKLRTFRDNLLGDTKQQYSPILDAEGGQIPIDKPPVTHAVDDLSRARSSVKEDVRGFYGGKDSATGSLGAAEAQRLADALSNDISDAARVKGGGALEADQLANKTYSAYKSKWSTPANRKILESGTPDELLSGIVNQGEDRALNAKAALTPMGHEALRSQIYQKLMDETGGDPQKFLAALKPMKKSIPVLFEGNEGAKLEGLTKIMQVSSNVGNASGPLAGGMAASATGNPFLMAGGAMGGAVLGKLHFGSGPDSAQMVSRMTKYLLSTDAGQNWLLKVSKMKPYSPELQQAMGAIERESGLASGQIAAPDKRQQAIDRLLGKQP